MDDKDEKILDHLKRNGRASYTEIAEKMDVSEGTVRNRVEKMMEKEVIENFTVQIGNKGSKAVVMVNLDPKRDIQKVLEGFPKDIKVMEVTGEFDLVLQIEKPSNKEINDLLDEIRSISGVKNTETYMVLEER